MGRDCFRPVVRTGMSLPRVYCSPPWHGTRDSPTTSTGRHLLTCRALQTAGRETTLALTAERETSHPKPVIRRLDFYADLPYHVSGLHLNRGDEPAELTIACRFFFRSAYFAVGAERSPTRVQLALRIATESSIPHPPARLGTRSRDNSLSGFAIILSVRLDEKNRRCIQDSNHRLFPHSNISIVPAREEYFPVEAVSFPLLSRLQGSCLVR
jgi:hypothetical protein